MHFFIDVLEHELDRAAQQNLQCHALRCKLIELREYLRTFFANGSVVCRCEMGVHNIHWDAALLVMDPNI